MNNLLRQLSLARTPMGAVSNWRVMMERMLKSNMQSPYLNKVIEKQAGRSSMLVVALDIAKYSMRKSARQKQVIDAFTKLVNEALREVSAQHKEDVANQDVTVESGTILIPTGDGLAAVFAFEGCPAIHMDFATAFLSGVHAYNATESCEKYDQQGWCNCHSKFGVRIGVSNGTGIVYRDVNGNYNVAGGPINLAFRVMECADAAQILLDIEAYKTLVDLSTASRYEDTFTCFPNVKLKHGIRSTLYQYRPTDEKGVSSEMPERLRIDQAMTKVQGLIMPGFAEVDGDGMNQVVRDAVAVIATLFPNALPSSEAANDDDLQKQL